MTDDYLAERLKKPHTVYRFLDVDGALLYVGCTSRLRSRIIEHHANMWWSDVATIESTEYPNGFLGYMAESVAHKQERGRYVINPSIPSKVSKHYANDTAA